MMQTDRISRFAKLDETSEYYKSARTVDAKGHVFPGPLTQSALAGGRRLFFW